MEEKLIIKDIKQSEYDLLLNKGLVMSNILYKVYIDKRTCLLCQKEYLRYNINDNPNFCPDCLNLLTNKGD
jgi:hypothetical protein